MSSNKPTKNRTKKKRKKISPFEYFILDKDMAELYYVPASLPLHEHRQLPHDCRCSF